MAGSSAGSMHPPAHGSALLAIASDSPHIVFRQAITSPILASTPRNPRVPATSVAFTNKPMMKSSLTASRVQPCSMARGRNPLFGKNLLRSEEHTSELQSQFHLVCRLLLEK